MHKETAQNILPSSAEASSRLIDFLLEGSDSSTLILSSEGSILGVNSVAQDFFGYPEDKFLKLDIFEIVLPEFQEKIRSELDNTSKRTENNFTITCLTAGEEEIPVAVSAKRVKGKNGQEGQFVLRVQGSVAEPRTHQLTKCEHSLLQSTKAISRLLIRENDMESLLDEAAKQLYEINGYRDVSIALLDEQKGEIKPIGSRGVFAPHNWTVTPKGKGENAPKCLKTLIEEGSIKVIEGADFCSACDRHKDQNPSKCILVPMNVKEKVVGFIQIIRSKFTRVEKEERQLLREIADDLAYARAKFQLERRLRESEKLLSDIFHSIQDGISLLNKEFEIVRANQWYQERYSEQTPLKGKTCYKVYHDRESICLNCPTRRTFKTGKVSRAIHEYPPDGDPNEWHELFAFPIKDETGEVEGVVKHVRNITNRKKAEQKLRKNKERLKERKQKLETLYSKLKGARERERKRISRLLHDELGQSISAAILNLSLLESSLGSSSNSEDTLQAKIEETQEILDETDDRIKQLAADLRPKMLDELGLVPAIRSYIDRFNDGHEVDIKLKASEFSPRLEREIETVIYRVTQEALANIAKHSGAERARVAIGRDEGKINLIVEDDGKGFDPEKIHGPESGHLGLTSMRERLDSLDGNFQIGSDSDSGTRIEASIPHKGE